MPVSIKEVKYMGYRWGDWVRDSLCGLGYPSETTISKLNTSPGRSARTDYSPLYEPDPVARRFEEAVIQIPEYQQYVIYCRFVLQLSDARLSESNSAYDTEGQARWAVMKAMREVGKVL